MIQRRFILGVVCLTLLFAVPTVSATTYIMVTDEDLVDDSDVVARVRVVRTRTHRAAGRIVTDYRVRVLDSYKGDPRGRLTLRRPGGALRNGVTLALFAMPTMEVGQEAMVFLVDNGDGSWGFKHLALGLFQLRTIGGQRVAYRLTEASLDLELPERASRRESLMQAHLPRAAAAFGDWIADRSAGIDRGRDYYLPEETLTHAQIDAFHLFDDGNGNNYHWHEFSPGANGSVTWVLDSQGMSGLSESGASALRNVVAAWNDVHLISMRYGGTTSARAGFSSTDGKNAWLFQDPNNDIEGSFSCSTGGVLAIGGIQTAYGPPHGATGTGGKRTYWDIAEGDVVFQNGIGCKFSERRLDAEKFIEQTGGHEVGHALGLGHSCTGLGCILPWLNAALMRATLHSDNRGADIKADDRAAAKALDYQR